MSHARKVSHCFRITHTLNFFKVRYRNMIKIAHIYIYYMKEIYSDIHEERK